jgi:hypothetical protein
MREWAHGGVRASAALMFVAVVALQTAGNAGADADATNVINVVAVNASGQPVDGYHVMNRQASPNLSGCSDPSPAAVGNDIYTCDPPEAAAEVCWPAPASLLCLSDPWTKALRRFPSPGALPAAAPLASPMPFAMQLDDGTRCILPNGVDLGGRADETVPIYGCGKNIGVLAPPDWNPADAIDRTQPLWAVFVGQLGPRPTPFPVPIRHTVTTAWFAG